MALNLYTLDKVQSINKIMNLEEVILNNFYNVPYYYCFNVYVVIRRKT